MIDDEKLARALGDVAVAMAHAKKPWWIIGSAAVALHGADPGAVQDIDVLFDPADAEAVLQPLGLAITPGSGTDRFRSAVFAQWTGAPMPVELFAGFEIRSEGAWLPVTLRTRTRVWVGGSNVWVPERAELKALLHSFGRAKDLARAASL